MIRRLSFISLSHGKKKIYIYIYIYFVKYNDLLRFRFQLRKNPKPSDVLYAHFETFFSHSLFPSFFSLEMEAKNREKGYPIKVENTIFLYIEIH